MDSADAQGTRRFSSMIESCRRSASIECLGRVTGEGHEREKQKLSLLVSDGSASIRARVAERREALVVEATALFPRTTSLGVE